MNHKKFSSAEPAKGLLRLIASGPNVRLGRAEAVVCQNRRLIRKAMKLGHSIEAIARELGIKKRTLQRHMNAMGLFYRKPRTKKGTVIKRNIGAIARAKLRILANV